MFTIETDSQPDRARQSQFVYQGLRFSEVSKLRPLLYYGAPKWINKLAGIEHPFNQEFIDFFCNTTKQVVMNRQKGIQKRQHDLVQVLLDSSVDVTKMQSDSWQKLTAHEQEEKPNENETNSIGGKKQVTTLNQKEVVGM